MIYAVRTEGEIKGLRTKVSNVEARRKAGAEGLNDN